MFNCKIEEEVPLEQLNKYWKHHYGEACPYRRQDNDNGHRKNHSARRSNENKTISRSRPKSTNVTERRGLSRALHQQQSILPLTRSSYRQDPLYNPEDVGGLLRYQRRAAAATAASINCDSTQSGFLPTRNPTAPPSTSSQQLVARSPRFYPPHVSAREDEGVQMDVDGHSLSDKSTSFATLASFAVGPSDFNMLVEQMNAGNDTMTSARGLKMSPKARQASNDIFTSGDPTGASSRLKTSSLKLSYAVRTALDGHLSERKVAGCNHADSDFYNFADTDASIHTETGCELGPEHLKTSALDHERIFPSTLKAVQTSNHTKSLFHDSNQRLLEKHSVRSRDDDSYTDSIVSGRSSVGHILGKKSKKCTENVKEGSSNANAVARKSVESEEKKEFHTASADSNDAIYHHVMDGLKLMSAEAQPTENSPEGTDALELQEEMKVKKEVEQVEKFAGGDEEIVQDLNDAEVPADPLEESIPIIANRRLSFRSRPNLPANEAMPSHSEITIHVPSMGGTTAANPAIAGSNAVQRNLASLCALRNSKSPVSASCSRQTSPTVSRSNSILLHPPLMSDPSSSQLVSPSTISRQASRTSIIKYSNSMRTRSHDVLDEVDGDGLAEVDILPLPNQGNLSPKRAVVAAMKRANSQVLSRDSSLRNLSRSPSSRKISERFDVKNVRGNSAGSEDFEDSESPSRKMVKIGAADSPASAKRKDSVDSGDGAKKVKQSLLTLDVGTASAMAPPSSHVHRIEILRKQRALLQNALADVETRLRDQGLPLKEQAVVMDDSNDSFNSALLPQNISDIIISKSSMSLSDVSIAEESEIHPPAESKSAETSPLSKRIRPADQHLVSSTAVTDMADVTLRRSLRYEEKASGSPNRAKSKLHSDVMSALLSSGKDESTEKSTIPPHVATPISPPSIKRASSIQEVDEDDEYEDDFNKETSHELLTPLKDEELSPDEEVESNTCIGTKEELVETSVNSPTKCNEESASKLSNDVTTSEAIEAAEEAHKHSENRNKSQGDVVMPTGLRSPLHALGGMSGASFAAALGARKADLKRSPKKPSAVSGIKNSYDKMTEDKDMRINGGQESLESKLEDMELNMTKQQQSSEEYHARKEKWDAFKGLTESMQKEIHFDKLYKRKVLGRGKFAAVYQGSIEVSDTSDTSDDDQSRVLQKGLYRNVALKISQFSGNDSAGDIIHAQPAKSIECLRSSSQSELDSDPPPPLVPVAEFLRELQTLHDLSGHPNIVELEGVLYKPLSLVLEIMDGSLANFLDDKNWQLSCNMDVKFGILADIASGLSHMHKKLYIHRDIKPHNILVSMVPRTSSQVDLSNMHSSAPAPPLSASPMPTTTTRLAEKFVAVVKLADFGTAMQLTDAEATISEPSGTSGYTAPEMYLAGQYGLPADVFSFGILAWELFSQNHHENPLKGFDAYVAAEKIEQEIRPDFGPEHAVFVKEAASRCWATKPQMRPTITSVDEAFQQVLKKDRSHLDVYDNNYAKNYWMAYDRTRSIKAERPL